MQRARGQRFTPHRLAAQQFVFAQLHTGPRRAGDVLKAGEEDHLNARLLRRASVDLGVLRRRSGGYTTLEWWWALPAYADALDQIVAPRNDT